MKTYVVERDSKLPLRFTGKLIGFAEDDSLMLLLYQTRAGRYVCEKITLPSERDPTQKHKAGVCKTRQKIQEFFGQSRIAHDLYRMADLEKLPQTEEFEDID